MEWREIWELLLEEASVVIGLDEILEGENIEEERGLIGRVGNIFLLEGRRVMKRGIIREVGGKLRLGG